jgi:methylmalonyl-CoA mutase N-terminal domain/subunit
VAEFISFDSPLPLPAEDEGMSDISRLRNEWEQTTLQEVLAAFPERRHSFETTSGIPVERLQTPEDVGTNYVCDLAFPGLYPFTRGVHPTMYRGRLWTTRQYAGYATAEESNQRYRYLLEQGQTGLSVAFDLPTQIGYDPDHGLAEGEVGKVGVSVSSLEDMETLFDGIPLDEVSISMTINAPAAVLLAMYVIVAKKQGVEACALTGTIQNDILKEYVARGTYIFPPRPSMRLITDTFCYCRDNLPRWNTISISGYHIREAGSTAVQEVAFTLANAIAYVQAAIDAGLNVDDFAPRLSFFFSAHSNLFEEAAKFRAARRMWARIMKSRFGARDPRSWMMRIHAQTAGSTLTAQQPDNNVVRVTLQALAAVLGGTQSLHTNSCDEALSLPTEDSVRIALRTQQIIAHESGVADTVDPLAGSYFAEYLTDQIEKRAQEYVDRIDALGGALAAIECGYVQRQIQESAYRWQRAVDHKEQIVVGVNEYAVPERTSLRLLKVDSTLRERQMAKLSALKQRRDNGRVKGLLQELEQAALRETPDAADSGTEAGRRNANLFAAILQCAESYATLGEICGVLRRVFGEYKPIAAF